MEGLSEIHCGPNNSWIGKSPVCVPKSCGRPLDIKHGYFIGIKISFMLILNNFKSWFFIIKKSDKVYVVIK